jgi:glutamine synthetase
MATAKDILDLIKEKDVKYVDVRFTDMRGKMQHVSFDIDLVDDDFLTDGTMFDGSSIAGWKAINESDMKLRPDLDSAIIDPFYQQTTLALFCDVVNPDTGTPYERDPRSIARAALTFVKSAGIGDTVYFGPEAEFFIFDDVRWSVLPHNTGYSYDASELPVNSGKEYPEGNMGHRPGPEGRLFPCEPGRQRPGPARRDAGGDGRTRHEAREAPPRGRARPARLGLKFDTMIVMADRLQLYKYVIQNVAHAYGKTATFMAKPMFADNGSGMHVHQSIWGDGKPLFAGDKYAGLSQMCLWYIGGVIKHAKAINAFSNSTTNSYKRLVPGYEAPVKLAYSARNRSASIRIPHVDSPKGKRIEVRFPDPMGNPYLTFTALLMAGLDGIINQIDPGGPADKNLYDLPPREQKKIPEVCGSLREALENLDKDRGFLKAGGVMSDDFIDAYIELKMEEVMRLQLHPHPVEFDMYFKC